MVDLSLSAIVLFVLSNERSGSSLLQLCLQVHWSLYAGQELYLLPFSTVDERGTLLPFEMKEVCVRSCWASCTHISLVKSPPILVYRGCSRM